MTCHVYEAFSGRRVCSWPSGSAAVSDRQLRFLSLESLELKRLGPHLKVVFVKHDVVYMRL